MMRESMEAAIAAIRTCKTLDSLDRMLRRFDLTDSQEIISCLNECMYSPDVFRHPGDEVSVDEEVETTKQIFLTGVWRISELYERMKISPKNAEDTSAQLQGHP